MDDLWILALVGSCMIAVGMYFFGTHRTDAAGLLVFFGMLSVMTIDLMQVMNYELFNVSRALVMGVVCVSAAIVALHSPVRPGSPRWSNWGLLGLGVTFLLWGVALLLHFTSEFGDSLSVPDIFACREAGATHPYFLDGASLSGERWFETSVNTSIIWR
jgi:hypothetical protein